MGTGGACVLCSEWARCSLRGECVWCVWRGEGAAWCAWGCSTSSAWSVSVGTAADAWSFGATILSPLCPAVLSPSCPAVLSPPCPAVLSPSCTAAGAAAAAAAEEEAAPVSTGVRGAVPFKTPAPKAPAPNASAPNTPPPTLSRSELPGRPVMAPPTHTARTDGTPLPVNVRTASATCDHICTALGDVACSCRGGWCSCWCARSCCCCCVGASPPSSLLDPSCRSCAPWRGGGARSRGIRSVAAAATSSWRPLGRRGATRDRLPPLIAARPRSASST